MVSIIFHWIDETRTIKKDCIPFSYLIGKAAKKSSDFFFIQIGACDGILGDPIREYILKYKWRGILIEPVRYLFDRLVNNYKGVTNLIFENVAIAETSGLQDIYRYKENQHDLPPWHEGTASLLFNFSSRHKDFIDNIDQRLTKEKVQCITFTNLLQKYNIKKIDLLCIDVEGYEYEILKTIDFNLVKPRIIYYESQCLAGDLQKKCIELLKDNGYFIVEFPLDACAFRDSKVIKTQIYNYMYRRKLILTVKRIVCELSKIYPHKSL